MYRTAARRLFAAATLGDNSNFSLRFLNPQSVICDSSRFCTSTSSQSISDQIQRPGAETASSSSNRSDSTASAKGWSAASMADDSRRHQRQVPRVEYQEEQARVLQVSLRQVLRLGWSEEAIIAGARDAGVSPSIVGSFPRKEAALVEFFMDECLQNLVDRIDSEEELQNLVPSEQISKLVRIRLEMQAPYVSKWPQALSIQAYPSNASTSIKQRAMLLDEIWHAVGDKGSDLDWYVKRTVLGGIYSTTEIFMLTDSSPDLRNTWAFLDNRVKDAFDLKNTIQEAKYLAEAVGAGMGSSLQGFVRRVFQG